MKRNMMRKNLTQSILRSLGRYIAIVAIIALGCAIFVGLRVTKTDMVLTGQDYTDEQNMFDLRLLSTCGWSIEQVEQIAALEGVLDAEGCNYIDAFTSIDGGDEAVYRFYSIPERINCVYLYSGRMPETADECLVDANRFGEDMIGKQLTVTQSNDEDTLDGFIEKTYTIVGRVSTPLYMDMNRGSTTIGSGTLSSFIYIQPDAFDLDYYMEIYITIPGDWTVYTDEYNDILDAVSEELKPQLSPLVQQRFDKLLSDAQQAYAEGLLEYEDGLKEFEEGKLEAQQKLDDALAQLEQAQQEIADGEAQIADGEAQLEEGRQQIADGFAQLEAGEIELENSKAQAYTQMAQAYSELMENYKLVTDGLSQVSDGLTQIDSAIAQIDDGLEQIESNLPLLQLMVTLSQSQVSATETALSAALLGSDETLIRLLTEQLQEQTEKLTQYQQQLETVEQTKLELETTRASLITQRAELVETQKTLNDSLDAINMGFKELETNESVANNQFAAAQAQINASRMELEAASAQLESQAQQLQQAKIDLEDGRTQLQQGWMDYEAGKIEAEAQISSAEAELADAWQQLCDAKEQIDEMEEPQTYALTRNTNAGYTSIDSNSDIVSGVARVLPVFFLLIAALVCITTMTRMVEEERTQIGTLKALGHSNAAIMGKYLWYSASAAIVGCILGVILGCTFFPILLWNAYGIIFDIRPDIVLSVDWALSLGITAAYLACSTIVTWYCCRRTLREVPAQLIRPKAPQTGKKILLEKLPVWSRLSFLNKVMLRNVVRYKQRMLMMLIGIGGCTALLLTGFGLSDTIVGLADAQFQDINHYDIQVCFGESLTGEQREEFIARLKEEGITSKAGFFYQSSVDLYFDGQSRDLYLIGADSSVRDYLNFASDGETLSLPGKGEALLSVGVAEIMGISVGDTVQLRDADLQSMQLTVVGIYENYVQNFVIVSPEQLASEWEGDYDPQMAYVTVRDGVDVHDANITITQMDNIMSTSVAADTANTFAAMMDALELLIAVIVFCAGLLGAIVLYNLTNININERIREIATIKVLGFNAAETSAYVFKENILLTVMGVTVGLPLGRWFLDFVMEHIKVDMVWFKTQVTVPSYIYSVLLTLLCAAAVDFIFHYKLQSINMAEALKSVE